MAIKGASVGKKDFRFFHSFSAEQKDLAYPYLFVFAVNSGITVKSGVDKDTGKDYSTSSVELISNIFVGNQPVHTGFITTSDKGIIDSIRKDFGTSSPIGSIGVFWCMETRGGFPIHNGVWVTDDPGVKKTRQEKIKEAWEYLESKNEEGISIASHLQFLFESLKDKNDKPLFVFTERLSFHRETSDLCFFGREAPIMVESFLKNGGVLEEPQEVPF